jgi:transcriptional regulator with XRE-family HTH domain
MPESTTDTPIGERIARFRARKGLTQLALGAMVRRSEDWVSKVERGVIPVTNFRMLVDLAAALDVKNLVDLTGRPLALESSDSPEHASVTAIRAAMSSLPATRGDAAPGRVLAADALAGRVADAWHVYDHDKARYARLGPMLPELLGQAHRTARTAGDEAAAAVATRSLVEVYHLLQVYLKRLGEPELARLAADRALTLATDTGDLVLMGASAWNLGAVMVNRGEGDLALDLARQMIGLMTPIPDDAPAEYVSVYGALHLVAVIAAARSGQSGRGWDFLADARRVSARMRADRNDWRTSFGPTNVAMHAVHLAGEEGDSTLALRYADDVEIIPGGVLPLERTTRYLVEVMNANRIKGDDLATFYMLQKIEEQSPEEIRYFPVAREAIRDLLKRERSIYRADLRGLATRVGVIG